MLYKEHLVAPGFSVLEKGCGCHGADKRARGWLVHSTFSDTGLPLISKVRSGIRRISLGTVQALTVTVCLCPSSSGSHMCVPSVIGFSNFLDSDVLLAFQTYCRVAGLGPRPSTMEAA